MANLSLFTVETPASIEEDGTEYSLATIVNGTVDAAQVCGRWWFGATDPTGARYRTYHDELTTLLASADFPSRAAAGWESGQTGWRNSLVFEDPVPLTAPWRLRLTTNSSGRYPFRAGVFPVGDPGTDALFAEDNSAPGGNAARVSVGDVYPTGGAAGTACYYVDGVFVVGAEEYSGTAAMDLAVELVAAGRKLANAGAGLDVALALAATGRSVRRAAVAAGVTLTLAAAGRKVAAGTANVPLALALAGVGRGPSGTVMRPFTGTVMRPFTGIIPRP